jgi:hypothetical protein
VGLKAGMEAVERRISTHKGNRTVSLVTDRGIQALDTQVKISSKQMFLDNFWKQLLSGILIKYFTNCNSYLLHFFCEGARRAHSV